MTNQEAFTDILLLNGFSELNPDTFWKLHPEYPDTTTFHVILQDDGTAYHKEVIYYDGRSYTVRNEFTADTPEYLSRGLRMVS